MSVYQGSCHCGRVRFEVEATIDHVRSCDCSLCAKRGALALTKPGVLMIRQAKSCDVESIVNIYNHYISNTVATFEEETISSNEMNDRIREITSIGLPWLVAENEGEIVGYAYASKWKGRCAYRFSVEVTVYLLHSATSNGWGTKLYEALFSELKENSIHVAIGGIALPNPASIALHEKLGMEKVAHFKEVGFKFGRWVDVGYWQVKLDVR